MDDFQPRIRDKTRPARVVARVTMRDRTAQFATMCAASTATVARVDGVDVGARVKETRANARANAKVATCETVRAYARTAAIALEATRTYVEEHRGRYKGASDRERDAFEAETSESIRECQRCVASARDAVENARDGGALARAPQCAAHLHGIGLILSESLNDVARAFDKVRETRFAATLERAERERQRKRAATRARYDDAGTGASGADDDGVARAVRVEGVEMRQEQVHAERQDGLEEELTQLLDEVRMAEKNVIEMSALSSLFATHVQAQAEQIESLYQDAIESSRHLDMGNVEMKKTIARKGSAQRYVALILLVATLGLLFLDWYSG